MRFDAQSPIVWRRINQAIRDKLKCESKVFLFRGMHHALFEMCLGLNLRFSHKKKIVTETGFGDHLRQAEMELAKLGVRFRDQFEDSIDVEEKNCLAYIHDLDDPLTAELYDHIETLKQIAPSKIYRVHLAHHLFHARRSFVKKLSEYDIIIAALDENYALAFTGEKITLPLLTVGQLAWSLEKDLPPVLDHLSRQSLLYHSEIVAFETSLPDGVRPWFTTHPAKRIYDRSAIILDDQDSSAMRDLLLEELGLASKDLGAHQSIEAASQCRWENDSWFKQAEAHGKSEEDMRGLLVLDAALLTKEFHEQFRNIHEKLKELSR